MLSKEQKYWQQAFHSIASDWTFGKTYTNFSIMDEPCSEYDLQLGFNQSWTNRTMDLVKAEVARTNVSDPNILNRNKYLCATPVSEKFTIVDPETGDEFAYQTLF